MGTGYTLAYGLKITPWETQGTDTDPAFDRLMDREELERTPPFGRALDLGCGTGAHTRRLQERGWEAMGVDNARKAVNTAVRLGEESARYVIGDVSYLVGCGVGKAYDFFLDVGCFHGLSDDARQRMGEGVTSLASPGATMLVLAGRPRNNPVAPRGAEVEDLTRAFPAWTVLDSRPADVSGMTSWMRRLEPSWHRLALTPGA